MGLSTTKEILLVKFMGSLIVVLWCLHCLLSNQVSAERGQLLVRCCTDRHCKKGCKNKIQQPDAMFDVCENTDWHESNAHLFNPFYYKTCVHYWKWERHSENRRHMTHIQVATDCETGEYVKFHKNNCFAVESEDSTIRSFKYYCEDARSVTGIIIDDDISDEWLHSEHTMDDDGVGADDDVDTRWHIYLWIAAVFLFISGLFG